MRAWLELPRIARPYRIVRSERVDEGAPCGRVWLGQETHRWHFGELRVAIVEVPVREREFQRLGHGVDVFGRVVAHPLEIECLKERERLEEDRPLAPKASLEHVKGTATRAKREPSRLLD